MENALVQAKPLRCGRMPVQLTPSTRLSKLANVTRGVAIVSLLLSAGCQQAPDSTISNNGQQADASTVPVALSALEVEARRVVATKSSERAQRALEGRARTALQGDLFDPFSARFANVRQGRNGAICGQYNARNRYGAYVGFRDFVVGRDRQTIYYSQNSDGVRSELFTSFAEAYLNACATGTEVAQYRRLTGASSPAEYRQRLTTTELGRDVMMDANAMDMGMSEDY